MREKGRSGGDRAFVEHYDMPGGVARISRVLGLEVSPPRPGQPELTDGIQVFESD